MEISIIFPRPAGVRYQKGFGKVGSKRYYFSTTDGKAQTGWLSLDGNSYYFGTTGVMYVNTTASIGGKTYAFDSNGVASEKQASEKG